MLILTTGGTIDKVYFDASSEYEVGEPTVPHVFREAAVTVDWRIESLFRKDSLELTDDDRTAIRHACEEAPENRILITHGTDTMCQTAAALAGADALIFAANRARPASATAATTASRAGSCGCT